MQRLVRACLAALLFTVMPPAIAAAAAPADNASQAAVISVAGQTIKVQVYADRVIRVTRAPGEQLPPIRSLAVTADPAKEGPRVYTSSEAVEVSTDALRIRIDRTTGVVSFQTTDGTEVLREGAATFSPTTIEGSDALRVQQRFVLAEKEAIFGLGQHADGRWDYRGTTVRLQQRNGDIAVPVLVSSRGYGVLWDNPAVTDVHVGIVGDEEAVVWDSEVGEAVDYYFIYGPDLDDVVRGYRGLTGAAPLWGKWAYGFWQCRERYESQEQILGVAREYRRRHIPIDGIIQDWRYWDPQPWGSNAFGENFPNPREMVKELHDAHYHTIISVWPKFEPGSDNFTEMKEAGHLYAKAYPQWNAGDASWYDPFSPAARQMYWRQIAEQIFAFGFDGWWLDATEPELGAKWGEMRDVQTGAGPGSRVYNAYALMTTEGVYEGQRAATDDKRVFILTRSAYTGMQRNAATAWSGDIGSDWATFRDQIPAGLNFVLTGIPYWNTDIGGFFSRSPEDADYRECFTRWFQFGAFCPMFRVHGTGAKKEMWEFGPDVEPILIAYDRLRYRLLPYIYSTAWRVTSDGASMMRPLVMDFRDDPQAVQTGDQFLFGPSIMVCPVTEPMGGEGTVIPTENLVDASGEPGGLTATYFQGRAFEEQRLTRKDATLSFDWDHTKREGVGDNIHRDPLPGMVMDHFSARWEGAVLTRRAGEYTFQLAADDGMRMWVNNELVIDDWNARAVVTRSAKVKLPADTSVPIKVEFFQYQGAATIELRWVIPSADRKAPSRSVYLPKSPGWYDFWTGERLTGGRTIDAPAPLETMPLYVRAGAIVPMGRVVQHAAESSDPIELRVYRGADAEFTLYEDAGDGYAYEHGAYATTPIRWNEQTGELTIGPRTGAYDNMPEQRTFHVVFVEPGHGVGGETTSPDQAVRLVGDKPVRVRPGQQPEPVAIRVDVGAAGKPISTDLFGVFFEDINHAADGGLYAELVRNRSFEFVPTIQAKANALTGWELVRRGGGRGWWAIGDVEPIHPRNPRFLVLHVDGAGEGVGVKNHGFGGIAVRAGKMYDFSVFAKQLYMDRRWGSNPDLTGRPMPLEVRLEDGEGNAVGSVALSVAGREWKKLTGAITAEQTVDDARLVVLAKAAGGVALDMISLFPHDTFKGRENGLRKDLAQAIADLKPAFIRFPGGCLVHGDGLGNMYRWKDTVGPVEQRQGQRNIWRYYQSVGLGYYEYFQFCEDIGAKPVPIVPAAVCCQHSGQLADIGQRGLPMEQMPAYVQEVLDLIEWANGPADSRWGRIRAEAGHPEPFGLEYVGVGNEDEITPVFEERFRMIFEAVRAKHPEITVIGTVGPFPDGEDFEKGWALARELNVPVVDEHYYRPPQWFWENLPRYDAYDRTESKVYVGEYAAHDHGRRTTLRSAMAEAAYLTSLERNGDVVIMTSYAPLLGKVGATNWNPDLIYFTNTEVAPTVNYYVQKLFGNNAGNAYLSSTVDVPAVGRPDADALVTSVVRDKESGDVIIKLVNGSATPQPVRFELIGVSATTLRGEKTVLANDDPMIVNSLQHPNAVAPQSSPMNVEPKFAYEAPAYSLTVMRLATDNG